MIRVTDLTKFYGAKRALDHCTFQIAAGEIVGLVGKNGAGKTTVLEVLSGQLLPSEGDVRIDGRSISENGHRARAKTAVPGRTDKRAGSERTCADAATDS